MDLFLLLLIGFAFILCDLVGQFFTATFLKLTTIPPAIGYNLAIPTFFAFTFAGAFSTQDAAIAQSPWSGMRVVRANT